MLGISIFRIPFFFMSRHFVIRPGKWQKVNRVIFTSPSSRVLRLRAPRQDAHLLLRSNFSHGSNNNSARAGSLFNPPSQHLSTKDEKKTITPSSNSSAFCDRYQVRSYIYDAHYYTQTHKS
jgi:hypothetical protein